MDKETKQNFTSPMDVNGYLSNLIHEDNQIMRQKSNKPKNTKGATFNEFVNDALTPLDITD
ncbi:hypothetical protein QBE52_12375 [Clostridiaceae bacterium 35-E11]